MVNATQVHVFWLSERHNTRVLLLHATETEERIPSPRKQLQMSIVNEFQNHFVGNKNNYRKNVTRLLTSKNNRSAKNTVVSDFLFFSGMTLAGSWSVVSNAHPSIHSYHGDGTVKITVGCQRCTQRVLSQDHGARRAHCQAFTQKLAHVFDFLVRTAKEKGLWASPPVLTPVPSQAIHSRVCLNSHHSDIQGTAQKSPCVNTFLRPSQKKSLSLSGCLGLVVKTWKEGAGQDTRDNRHVRQTERRCDTMQVAIFWRR